MIQKLMIFVKLCLSSKDDGGHGHVLPLPDGYHPTPKLFAEKWH